MFILKLDIYFNSWESSEEEEEEERIPQYYPAQ